MARWAEAAPNATVRCTAANIFLLDSISSSSPYISLSHSNIEFVAVIINFCFACVGPPIFVINLFDIAVNFAVVVGLLITSSMYVLV